MKYIIGYYPICDCEHYGDISSEKSWLLNQNPNIKILKEYWDGQDCGEAYIKFSFPENQFLDIYKKVDARYSEDINKYIDFSSYGIKNIPILSKQDFSKKCNEYYSYFDNEYITLRLFFQLTNKFSIEEVINKAIEAIGKDCIIEAYSVNKSDNDTYINVLFKTKLKNIIYQKIHDFGDFCIGRRGWLHDNHIYGELSINSVLKYGITYDNFDNLIHKISNKEKIIFQTKTYYNRKEIEVDYETYMKNNIIIDKIEKDNNIYYIKL